jgi:hypothetical protein
LAADILPAYGQGTIDGPQLGAQPIALDKNKLARTNTTIKKPPTEFRQRLRG